VFFFSDFLPNDPNASCSASAVIRAVVRDDIKKLAHSMIIKSEKFS